MKLIHSKSHLTLQQLGMFREASWTTCFKQCSIMDHYKLLSKSNESGAEKAVSLSYCSTLCNCAGRCVCFESM